MLFRSWEHVDRARPFIEAGLPVFIDKHLADEKVRPVAAHYDEANEFLDGLGITPPSESLMDEMRGKIIAHGSIVECFTVEDLRNSVELVRASESVLAFAGGPFCWLLTGVVRVDPIECRGAQGLWDVPADVADKLTLLTSRKECGL
mgnify:CR=1 FL=1